MIHALSLTVLIASKDVVSWKAEVEYEIEENGAKDLDLVVQINDAMTKMGIRDEGEQVDDASGDKNPGQEFNFAGYHGPNGRESLRRFVVNGTVGLLSYARDNLDKFHAYGIAIAAVV